MTRCLLADDHPGLTVALTSYLEDNGFEVIGPAANGAHAIALAAEEQPDVALIDYRMPRVAGRELLERVREAAPSLTVVVYTADADEALVDEAFAAGATGIVLKEAPLADVTRALDAAAAGRRYVDPALAPKPNGRAPGSRTVLTARETDVLRLLADGLSHEQVGEKLAISPETARTHMRKACERLGAATRTQAVALALRNGLID